MESIYECVDNFSEPFFLASGAVTRSPEDSDARTIFVFFRRMSDAGERLNMVTAGPD